MNKKEQTIEQLFDSFEIGDSLLIASRAKIEQSALVKDLRALIKETFLNYQGLSSFTFPAKENGSIPLAEFYERLTLAVMLLAALTEYVKSSSIEENCTSLRQTEEHRIVDRWGKQLIVKSFLIRNIQEASAATASIDKTAVYYTARAYACLGSSLELLELVTAAGIKACGASRLAGIIDLLFRTLSDLRSDEGCESSLMHLQSIS